MKLINKIITLFSPCKTCLNTKSCFFCEHRKWNEYRFKKTFEEIKERNNKEE